MVNASTTQQKTPQQTAQMRDLATSFIGSAIHALEYECQPDEINGNDDISTLCVEISGRAFGKYVFDEINVIQGSEDAFLEPVGSWNVTNEVLTHLFRYHEKIYDLHYTVKVSIYEKSLYIDVRGPVEP
jgi:hypothetical protein